MPEILLKKLRQRITGIPRKIMKKILAILYLKPKHVYMKKTAKQIELSIKQKNDKMAKLKIQIDDLKAESLKLKEELKNAKEMEKSAKPVKKVAPAKKAK